MDDPGCSGIDRPNTAKRIQTTSLIDAAVMTGICLRRIVINPPLSMFQKSNTLPVILILHRINPDFGAGGAAGRDRQIEAVESFSLPPKVTRRTPAQNSWYFVDHALVVWITL